MHVKKFFLLLTVLTSTFAFTSFVQADGDHSNHSDISNAITNFQGNEQQPSGKPHSNMNHGESHEEQANIQGDDHSTSVQDEQQGHSDSGHGGDDHSDSSVIEETPPNYKVLGTFGLINMSFLGLGVILKLRRRKESTYETIK
ncbi:hypothetical protein [Schinkia azotoformans]|uniref:hypothetical protein n=1 Tax=Schinkia azotoformans TaxID=1454 RepID=UPI002DBB6D66|nr:hypothetical protein [Schinkia azotoformans]MEC1743337.1 hypothetical protein [Schinkia azotoformans]MEC1769493.1 hypothetical protein [Schinkia azotoformans]MEC1788657.1 hypothetical protein [Schinkia azotoformans]MED4377329.1 hypothetical protein [Schinkia azotoformans]MED4420166.1 hypothetical protein [Schinkia azotoformans]